MPNPDEYNSVKNDPEELSISELKLKLQTRAQEIIDDFQKAFKNVSDQELSDFAAGSYICTFNPEMNRICKKLQELEEYELRKSKEKMLAESLGLTEKQFELYQSVYIDGVLVGIANDVKVTMQEECTPDHGLIDSIKNGVELEGTLKGRRYTDAFQRVVNRSGRKSEDKKEEKLPRKLRRGW